MDVNQLREQRADVGRKMKAANDAAEAENRTFTEEEQATWDACVREIAELDARIERQEQQILKDIADVESQHRAESVDRQVAEYRGPEENRPLTLQERSQAFRYWACAGADYPFRESDETQFKRSQLPMNNRCYLSLDRGISPSGERLKPARSIAEAQRQATWRMEKRADLTNIVGTDNLGGYLVADEMMLPLERALLAFGGMRAVSTIRSTATGADLPIPTLNDTAIKGELVAEDTEVSKQEMIFGQIVLETYKYSSRMIAASIELIQDSNTSIPELVGSVAGERIGRIANEHWTTGTGTGQPNGIVTAAADSGVTFSATKTWDELVSVKHSVDPAYRTNATWMFNDAILAEITSLKDSQGLPIWQPSIVPGEPDRILGHPYQINQDMASGSASKSVLFGDLSKYMIREVMNFELLRLNERYAEFGRVAWIGWMRMDGDLIDAGTGPVKYATNAI